MTPCLSSTFIESRLGRILPLVLGLTLIAALLPLEPTLLDERSGEDMLATLPIVMMLAASVAEDYRAAVAKLAEKRGELATRPPRDRLTEARSVLLTAFDEQLFPAWEGTPWDFYGTTQTPREGHIACGYFVSTLLRDAGLKVERVKLAQQASEKIVKTLASEPEIQRFRNAAAADIVKAVREKHGPGLFVVGMDYHVGLLRLTADDALLCHSAVLEPRSATCEKAETSPGFVSSYHVIGPALNDARLGDWLAQRDVPTQAK